VLLRAIEKEEDLDITKTLLLTKAILLDRSSQDITKEIADLNKLLEDYLTKTKQLEPESSADDSKKTIERLKKDAHVVLNTKSKIKFGDEIDKDTELHNVNLFDLKKVTNNAGRNNKI